MEAYNGICRYCGQVHLVEAESQEEANVKSCLLCDCDEGVHVRAFENMKVQILDITTNCQAYGYDPLDEDVSREILALGVEVLRGTIVKATINLENGKVTISKKGGAVKVSREEKKVLSTEM